MGNIWGSRSGIRVQLLLRIWTGLQACSVVTAGPFCRNPPAQALQLGDVYTGSVPSGCTVDHSLAASELESGGCGQGTNGSYVRFEYWSWAADGSPSSGDGLMLVSQGTPARGSYQEATDTWTLTAASGGLPLPGDLAAADWPNFRLLRGYQQVTLPVHAAGPFSSWFVALQNVDIWVRGNLSYALRVSCAEQPSCPADITNPTADDTALCTGRGSCRPASHPCSGTSQPCALCQCQPGWGDIACQTQLQTLQQNEAFVPQEPVAPGDWAFYDLQLPEDASQLLVELTRSSGDPVLFVKPLHAGFQPGGLPSVQDYNTYAARQYFAERSNTHIMHLTNLTDTRYYVAVYNHDAYLQEGATFELNVEWITSDIADAGLCPGNCSSRGRCALNGTCACDAGWVGDACASQVQDITLGATAGGALVPGQWTYFHLRLSDSEPDRSSWSDGLIMFFHANGGHPVLVAAHEKLPSLGGTDLLFTWRRMWSGEQRFFVKGSDLHPGDWYIGVFNLDYYTHSRFDFLLSVDSSSLASRMMAPFASVGFGVSASLFLFALFSVFRRVLWERHLSRLGIDGEGPAAARTVPQGVAPDVIAAFPTRLYKAEEEAQSPTRSSADSENEPHCTVCLGEYEDGEMLRQLPCGHDFHLKCIDLWLGNHRTCPICRGSVVPDDDTPFEATQQPTGVPTQNGPAIEMLEVARQASTNASASPNDIGYFRGHAPTTLTDARTVTDTAASPSDSRPGQLPGGFRSLWGRWRLNTRSWTRMSGRTETLQAEPVSAVVVEGVTSGSVREDSFELARGRDRMLVSVASDRIAGRNSGVAAGIAEEGQHGGEMGHIVSLGAGSASARPPGGASDREGDAACQELELGSQPMAVDQRSSARSHSWRTFYGGPRGTPSILEGHHEGDGDDGAGIDARSAVDDDDGDASDGPVMEVQRTAPHAFAATPTSAVTGRHGGLAGQWGVFGGLGRLLGRGDPDGSRVPLRGPSQEDSVPPSPSLETARPVGMRRQTSMAERFLGRFVGSQQRASSTVNVPISVPSQLV